MTSEIPARPGACRQDANGRPPFAVRALPFVRHYVLRRRWHFGGLFMLLIGGATCAVAVQYGMRLLVDAMSTGEVNRTAVWTPFALFVCLIGLEAILWRSAGWLTCRTVISTCVDIRLDLFDQLRPVERAAVPDCSNEAGHLQRRDLHFALTNGLIHHIDRRRGVDDPPGFLLDVLDAGALAQAKSPRHICNVVRTVVLEQGIANMPEVWITGAHQAFLQI